MASGDIKSQLVSAGRLTYALQDATGAGDAVGVWVDCREYLSGIVTWETGTGVVEIDVSNSVTNPGTGSNGVPFQAALNTIGVITMPSLPNWVKARITTFTTGPINVFLTLRAAISS